MKRRGRHGRAKARKLTRAVLIDRLAQRLMRTEPFMRGHEDDAKFRVSHTSPGRPDTLRDLALSARIHEVITEDEYVAIVGERERLGSHGRRT
jgi:hypothetical protein